MNERTSFIILININFRRSMKISNFSLNKKRIMLKIGEERNVHSPIQIDIRPLAKDYQTKQTEDISIEKYRKRAEKSKKDSFLTTNQKGFFNKKNSRQKSISIGFANNFIAIRQSRLSLEPQRKQKIIPLPPIEDLSQERFNKTNDLYKMLQNEKFIIEKSNSIIEIQRKHFKTILNIIINCEEKDHTDDKISNLVNQILKQHKKKSRIDKIRSVKMIESKGRKLILQNVITETYNPDSSQENSSNHILYTQLTNLFMNNSRILKKIKNNRQSKSKENNICESNTQLRTKGCNNSIEVKQDSRIIMDNFLQQAPFSYVLEQNQLLAKIASAEFKKIDKEIFQYGLALQSQQFEIDLEHIQESTSFTLKNELRKSLNNILYDSDISPPQQSKSIMELIYFHSDNAIKKNEKLQGIIDSKSAFISNISLHMSKWQNSLDFKKKYLQNLRRYADQEFISIENIICQLGKELNSGNREILFQRLRKNLGLLEKNIKIGNQFN